MVQFMLPYHNGPTSKCSMKCNRFDCCVQMEKTILFSLVVVVILANYFSAAAFAPRGRVELKAAIDACVNRQIPTSNVQSTSGKRSPVKLIFLDVDGVLNSHQSRFAKWLGETSAGSAKGFVKELHWDDTPHPGLLGHLKLIIDNTGAQVVISSTWRLDDNNLKRLYTALETIGVTPVGLTDSLALRYDGSDRPDEIRKFILESEMDVKAWVALDDLPLHDLGIKPLEPEHFVQTLDVIGLTYGNAAEAVRKLNIAPLEP